MRRVICVPGSPIDCAATIPTASRGSTFASSYFASTFRKIASNFSALSLRLTALNFSFNSDFIFSDNCSQAFTRDFISASFSPPSSRLPSIFKISAACASSIPDSKSSSRPTVSSATVKSPFPSFSSSAISSASSFFTLRPLPTPFPFSSPSPSPSPSAFLLFL